MSQTNFPDPAPPLFSFTGHFLSDQPLFTFVDLCLLERDECLKWAENHLVGQLNEFEKILLIEELVRRKENESAGRIANAMVLKEKINKEPFKNFKKQFETVLNAK